jgi:23S rRNA pseudouridine1911/1915/1917 synthase
MNTLKSDDKYVDYLLSSYEGERIDKALSLVEPSFSRENFIELIKDGEVTIAGKKVKPSYRIEGDEVARVHFKKKNPSGLSPYYFPLDVVYEDSDILVIDKPSGLVVHPGNGHHEDTLVNALIARGAKLSSGGDSDRPGIVHRIDKDTSGLLLVAKNDEAQKGIAEQLSDHSMHREYCALVDGEIQENEGKIIGAIGRDPSDRIKMAIVEGGKSAVTHFKVLKRYRGYTLLTCRLETGRTHQIRVHLSSIGHPIVGDKLYGGSIHLYQNGQLLHAYRLSFIHPRSKEKMTLTAPLPSYFVEIIKNLNRG